jgi:hypothetical protein
MKALSRIDEFIELVSNIMEAYSTTLFLADTEGEGVILSSFLSLGSNIKKDCKVLSGEGIIGWVFREQKPVLAGYFDKHDATTLKFYEKDEEIKSLIAIPLPQNYGVLCVDSKKSYVFTEEKEKILRQMAQVLVSIIHAENEITGKKTVEKLLGLSINANELLVNTKDKKEFVKEFLELFAESIHAVIGVLVEEGNVAYYRYKANKETFYQELSYEFFDNYGLAGWVLKNKRELFLEKITKNDKSFILYKEEPFENFTNFLCFPVTCGKTKKNGAMAFVKKMHKKWLPQEKKTVVLLGNLFFKEYLDKK